MQGQNPTQNKNTPLQFSPKRSKTKRRDKCFNVYIKTFGCQMNRRDTEIAKDVLAEGGFVFTDDEKQADIILYNTCSVREHAEDRVIGKMGQLSKRKEDRRKTKDEREKAKETGNKLQVTGSKSKNKDERRNPKSDHRPILGIIGCMATIHKEKLFDKIPGLDLICGPSNIYNLKEDLEKVLSKNIKIADIEEKDYLKPKYKHIDKRDSQVSAWVSIMEGCENFCSYCVVPYARGKEISRSADEIIGEINELVDKGFKEVTLLGQNVNSYGIAHSSKLIAHRKNKKQKSDIREPRTANQSDFVKLLKSVNDETDIKRIRFTTSHPKDTSEELFKAMRDLDKVCPHLHLPLQSGSDKILKLMNRNYTSEKYRKLIDQLRNIYAGCSISTDVIVGFPSETEDDFKDTYNLMEEIEFDGAYIFKYSPRPNTEASKLEDDVPIKVKKKRNQELLKLQEEISLKKNEQYMREYVKVLSERKTDKKLYLDKNKTYEGEYKYTGRTPDNKIVLFKGKKELVGEEVEVKVLNTTAHSLVGSQVTSRR